MELDPNEHTIEDGVVVRKNHGSGIMARTFTPRLGYVRLVQEMRPNLEAAEEAWRGRCGRLGLGPCQWCEKETVLRLISLIDKEAK